MDQYIPSPEGWGAEQVALYEGCGGTKGLTLRNTDLPVVIVTSREWKTGAIRETPLMRIADGGSYILAGSNDGAPDNPLRVYNLRADPSVTDQDATEVYEMRAREFVDSAERERLWAIALGAFPHHQRYQDDAEKAGRVIPVLRAEPVDPA